MANWAIFFWTLGWYSDRLGMTSTGLQCDFFHAKLSSVCKLVPMGYTSQALVALFTHFPLNYRPLSIIVGLRQSHPHLSLPRLWFLLCILGFAILYPYCIHVYHLLMWSFTKYSAGVWYPSRSSRQGPLFLSPPPPFLSGCEVAVIIMTLWLMPSKIKYILFNNRDLCKTYLRRL